MCGIVKQMIDTDRLYYPFPKGMTGSKGHPGPVGINREELERLKHIRIMKERLLKLEKITNKICTFKQI